MGQQVWYFLNSQAFLVLAVPALAWCIRKLFDQRPAWAAYKGTMISLIRQAEKAIPDDTQNKGMSRADYVLKGLLERMEKDGTAPTTEAGLAALRDAISLTHNEVFPANAAALMAKIKALVPLLALALCLPVLSGCLEAPAPVLAGHDQAAKCVLGAQAMNDQVAQALQAALRAERKAHAEYALQKSWDNVRLEAAKNAGKVDAEPALKYLREAVDARDREVAAMEAVIRRYAEAQALAQRETALALDLMGALRKYDAVGADPVKTATEAVDAGSVLIPGLKAAELK